MMILTRSMVGRSPSRSPTGWRHASSPANSPRTGPVPSETQLGQIYPVSRDTIRRAVRELRARGLVYTVQGKGSYVTPPEDRPATD